jgi:hypothetical protein
MTETVPARPFDDMEALAWLRSQPDGRVTASGGAGPPMGLEPDADRSPVESVAGSRSHPP